MGRYGDGRDLNARTLGQDGFSARVGGVRRAVDSPDADGWAGKNGGFPAGAGTDAANSGDVHGFDAVSGAASVTRRPWREATRTEFSAQAGGGTAYGMALRRAVEFADNGDGTLTAVRCIDPSADDLDIQYEAGERPVVAIAPKAFAGTALRRVVLPEALRAIGEMAFSGCAELTAVTIPGNVARVGTLAFAKCAQLERVRIEPGVQAIGPSCFSKCARLLRVNMPMSMQSIGGGAFFGCGKQLVLHGAQGSYSEKYAALNGIRFDSMSWQDDPELIFEPQEDGTLTVLGAREANPERIDIPSELCGRAITRIAPRAFVTCGTLAQLHIGGGMREIGESAFLGCRSLTSVRLDRGIERVGESAFAGCEALSTVTLPSGTGLIARMAFFGCTRLSFVKLPPTTRIADLAFDGCAPNLRVLGGVYVGRIPQNENNE